LSSEQVSALGEHALIDRVRARLGVAPGWVHVGVGDDAAVVEPARNLLQVVTTDAIVDGVHVDRTFVPARAIGHRALAVNLSDVAAMGGTPTHAVLSLILPASLPVADLDGLLDGFLELAARHKVALVGGNVTRTSGPLVVDVTAMGTVRRRRVLLRSGARPGDGVYVSGTIGAARAGLEMCRAGLGAAGEEPVNRYLYPTPRVRLGATLGRNRTPSAAIDLSDGLADGLRQLSAASGTGLAVEASALPIDRNVRDWFVARGTDFVIAALEGGDDYELLFTVPPRRERQLRQIGRLVQNLPLTRIGVVTREPGLHVIRDGRSVELPSGYEHFVTSRTD
jgi:thiamine-monophosphate kinase